MLKKIQVVEGLSYIHQELQLYVGNLDCTSVLVRGDGRIKIGRDSPLAIRRLAERWKANIAVSVFEQKALSPGRENDDIKQIGSVMIELIESATSILEPNTRTLKNPEI